MMNSGVMSAVSAAAEAERSLIRRPSIMSLDQPRDGPLRDLRNGSAFAGSGSADDLDIDIVLAAIGVGEGLARHRECVVRIGAACAGSASFPVNARLDQE